MRNKSDAARTMMVCVDSYEHNIFEGRYYGFGQAGEELCFHNLVQLLTAMERMLDDANFPQSFTAVRSFTDASGEAIEDATGVPGREGKCATFVVKVLFRQHTSWQGTVRWLEKNVEQPFRSVLELIFLMDSALARDGA